MVVTEENTSSRRSCLTPARFNSPRITFILLCLTVTPRTVVLDDGSLYTVSRGRSPPHARGTGLIVNVTVTAHRASPHDGDLVSTVSLRDATDESLKLSAPHAELRRIEIDVRRTYEPFFGIWFRFTGKHDVASLLVTCHETHGILRVNSPAHRTAFSISPCARADIGDGFCFRGFSTRACMPRVRALFAQQLARPTEMLLTRNCRRYLRTLGTSISQNPAVSEDVVFIRIVIAFLTFTSGSIVTYLTAFYCLYRRHRSHEKLPTPVLPDSIDVSSSLS